MTQHYSNEYANVDSQPQSPAEAANGFGARLRRYRATIPLASQASGDTIVLGDIPANSILAFGVLTSDTSLGAATLAIGDASSAAKYRAASTFTATDTPTPFGKASAVSGAQSTDVERVIATIGTAALPASGTAVVDLYFSGV